MGGENLASLEALVFFLLIIALLGYNSHSTEFTLGSFLMVSSCPRSGC